MLKIIKKIIPDKVKVIIRNQKRKLCLRKSAKYIKPIQAFDKVLDCQIAYNEYGGYCTPISSQQRPAVQKILNGDVHEHNTIEFIRDNCNGGDVIHAGTFFGDFLPRISTGMEENAIIWAFEPNPENYKCAQITSVINSLENVILKNAGLGESKSIQKMQIKSDLGVNLGGGSRIVNSEQNGKTIEIEVVSIDDIVPKQRNVSIIQLDVEGYEKEALQGALITIRRCKPILILEDNNDVISSSWFTDNISSLGYEISNKVHFNTVLKIKTVH